MLRKIQKLQLQKIKPKLKKKKDEVKPADGGEKTVSPKVVTKKGGKPS